jgi:hypothetical protein
LFLRRLPLLLCPLPVHHQSSALTIDKARDLHASVAPHVVDAGMQPYAVSAGMSVSALLGGSGSGSGSGGSGDGAKSLIKKLISLQKDVAATTTAAAAAAATK